MIRSGRILAIRRRDAAYHALGLLSCYLCMVCPPVAAQQPPLARIDPFISAIENIKRSVASIACLAVGPIEAKIVKQMGSAFLISESGDFLTAAHVLAAMQKGDDPCPISAITLPVGGWRPEAPAEQMLWFPFKT